MNVSALPYHEPGIVTILIQSSFLLLLNATNYVLDNIIYCGLLGQVFIGIAWGTPGANWLSQAAQDTVMQLGYLGLILIVYEGGLSTSFTALRANLFLSALVALIGISVPIGLSFALQKLLSVGPLQTFAAGAALCSTSLGTTFTILSTSGLSDSRLGVILSSAAMMDDVVGLVMVQVISNLGTSGSSFSSTTVVRPVFVSIAFAVILPVVCRLLILPATKLIQYVRASKGSQTSQASQLSRLPGSLLPLCMHTAILIGMVTGSTYAGTSNLFAAYLAGAAITWWDALPTHSDDDNKREAQSHGNTVAQQGVSEPSLRATTSNEAMRVQSQSSANLTATRQTNGSTGSQARKDDTPLAGVAIYERYYEPAVSSILKPFFFASIGFSIPITQMFAGHIVWKGIVYTILMLLGKLVTGLCLIRFTGMQRIGTISGRIPFRKGTSLRTRQKKSSSADNTTAQIPLEAQQAGSAGQTSSNSATNPAANTSKKVKHPGISKPRSLYPAAILGSAMMARGEIGFLISSLAESDGVFGSSSTQSGSSDLFLVVTWAILLCTIIGPVSVGVMVKRVKRLQSMERGRRNGKEDPLGVWGVL